MQTRAPTRAQVVVMVVFALSCFGLLLFLWSSFGGPIPLRPKGYRVAVRFPEASKLAPQGDVRISGIPVGKVVSIDRQGDRTRAILQIDPRYAPLPRDVRAMLRLKTLLGETYVELTPGTRGAGTIPDGGRLPDGQVRPAVQIDEVLSGFDAPTRAAFKAWITGWAKAVRDTGPDLNGVAGHLAAFSSAAAGVAATLRSQRAALRRLIRDAGIAFAAIGRREAATRTLVTAGERVLRTTARRDDDLRATLRALPPFLNQLRPTLAAARATGHEAAPVLHALRPVAPLLAPTLDGVSALAPDLRSFLRRLDPALRHARRGLPAATRMLLAARPLLARLHLAARDLIPIVDYLAAYRSELVQSWINVAAATEPTYHQPGARAPVHYLRTLVPFTVDGIAQERRRLASNRHNAYFAPGGLDRLAGGLQSFDCTNLANPQPLPVLGATAPCRAQAPWTFRGARRAFPHLLRANP